ncbi:hypothetical protein LCGC14_2814840 [marine sediment metagenome]|uniref:Uncharacterized protein n=1 Tax=marine sediment metagenome TaxID=412755 RepID=A0A0F8Z5L1_9ZZZZ
MDRGGIDAHLTSLTAAIFASRQPISKLFFPPFFTFSPSFSRTLVASMEIAITPEIGLRSSIGSSLSTASISPCRNPSNPRPHVVGAGYPYLAGESLNHLGAIAFEPAFDSLNNHFGSHVPGAQGGEVPLFQSSSQSHHELQHVSLAFEHRLGIRFT